MKYTEENRLKLAEAVWETLTLDDIHVQFIHTACARYMNDPDSFYEDAAVMDIDANDKEKE